MSVRTIDASYLASPESNPFTHLFSDIPSSSSSIPAEETPLSYTQFKSIAHDKDLPNFAISYSLYILNAGCCLREEIRSSTTIGSTLKTLAICTISYYSTAFFTLSAITEAIMRLATAILLLPVLCAVVVLEPDTSDLIGAICGLVALSGIYNLATCGAGFVGAYEMVTTDSSSRMRDVTEIADTASCGLTTYVKTALKALEEWLPLDNSEDLYT